ncbi:hypothetical protein RND71_008088 [Anisodus tanguticus]|uniref:Uncharacterized protein n=1 Tax=Anisodus tanguticus TaxID=243964 RepID=A0AAE1SL30_9SOLA|nr:hypothetical protein RND71_008088 [Anisodus tanguticus]
MENSEGESWQWKSAGGGYASFEKLWGRVDDVSAKYCQISLTNERDIGTQNIQVYNFGADFCKPFWTLSILNDLPNLTMREIQHVKGENNVGFVADSIGIVRNREPKTRKSVPLGKLRNDRVGTRRSLTLKSYEPSYYDGVTVFSLAILEHLSYPLKGFITPWNPNQSSPKEGEIARMYTSLQILCQLKERASITYHEIFFNNTTDTATPDFNLQQAIRSYHYASETRIRYKKETSMFYDSKYYSAAMADKAVCNSDEDEAAIEMVGAISHDLYDSDPEVPDFMKKWESQLPPLELMHHDNYHDDFTCEKIIRNTKYLLIKHDVGRNVDFQQNSLKERADLIDPPLDPRLPPQKSHHILHCPPQSTKFAPA